MKTTNHQNSSPFPHLLQKIPKESQKLWDIFGDKIRLVGGCVRDLILKRPIKDFDFACAFKVEEILQILQENSIKTVTTGLKYGSITALLNKQSFEITALRLDKNQLGRDCEVEFVSDFALDATRRDFTINALYLDKDGNVFDYFEGLTDLASRQVRFIGSPEQRIAEDYLRILRFFRFSCQYAKNFDKDGLKACVEAKENLKKLSKERIRGEFLKIIQGNQDFKIIETFQALEKYGFLEEIFSNSLDLAALERFYLLRKQINHNFEKNLMLSCLIKPDQNTQANMQIHKKLPIKFWQEICATNQEKAFFNNLQKISDEFLTFASEFFRNQFKQKLSKTIDFAELKQFLTVFSRRIIASFDKETAKNWLIYCFSKDFIMHQIPNINAKNCKLNLANQQYQDLVKFLFVFISNLKLLQLPINGSDLKNLGFKGSEIKSALIRVRKFWADNQFKPEREEILEFLNQKNQIIG